MNGIVVQQRSVHLTDVRVIPVKTVGRITYIVLVQTLDHAQSINQSVSQSINQSINHSFFWLPFHSLLSQVWTMKEDFTKCSYPSPALNSAV